MPDDPEEKQELSHIDSAGRARMVDVGGKPVTLRRARAAAAVRMSPATLRLLREQALPKGDVLTVAQVAGIMAAKETARLIPMCHPLPLDDVSVALVPDESLPGIRIEAAVTVQARTGVEMEALTAASVAALTVYDMCKAVDRGMEIEGVCLLEKHGGRHDYLRPQ